MAKSLRTRNLTLRGIGEALQSAGNVRGRGYQVGVGSGVRPDRCSVMRSPRRRPIDCVCIRPGIAVMVALHDGRFHDGECSRQGDARTSPNAWPAELHQRQL
jgi:hypothetical protein